MKVNGDFILSKKKTSTISSILVGEDKGDWRSSPIVNFYLNVIDLETMEKVYKNYLQAKINYHYWTVQFLLYRLLWLYTPYFDFSSATAASTSVTRPSFTSCSAAFRSPIIYERLNLFGDEAIEQVYYIRTIRQCLCWKLLKTAVVRDGCYRALYFFKAFLISLNAQS